MTATKDSFKKIALTAMLPTAGVHVFSAEEHTQDIVTSLSGDWRFGRVSLEVHGKSIDDAVTFYDGVTSPHIVIVQTTDTGPAFQEKLGKLAANCAEGTSALVIGPTNDVQLYRTLTGIGVSDYLVHPVSLYDMAEAISRTLLTMLGASNSKLIAIVGAKGGVGTTNVAHMAASISADVLGQKTVLLDAAAGHSTLWAQFGLNPTGTLVEAAKAAVDRDHDTLSRILMAVSENLTFMNTGAEPLLMNTSQQKIFDMLLERMLAQYPVVVADLSSTSPSIQASLLARANGVLVVTPPTVNALSLTRTLVKEVLAMRGNDNQSLKLIVNRRGEIPAYEVPEKDIAEAVGLDVAATIAYTPKIFLKAESEGHRPSDIKDGEKLLEPLQSMIAAILNVDDVPHATDDSSKGGRISSLLKKIGA
jgi:pilus assembly protein CpaE